MERGTELVAPVTLFKGGVFHARYRPQTNRFSYPLFFLRINLSRLAHHKNSHWFGINCWRPLAFYSRDHGAGSAADLVSHMRSKLTRYGITPPCGAVHLYTLPRVWGFTFKPVSFWHWHDEQGQLKLIVAQVNNTFGEQHCYALETPDGGPIRSGSPLQARKCFHVSPFCPIEGHYEFRPQVDISGYYRMGIDYHDRNGLLIRTSQWGKTLPFTAKSTWKLLAVQPALTIGVIFRIHWQALRLLAKRIPFYSKPVPPTAEVTK